MDRIIRGVYQIRCKATGQIYIGSANNIETRWITHFKQLAEKTHTNYKIQDLYNKYGRDNFETSLLEEAPKNHLRLWVYDMEQRWIDKYPDLLNINRDAKAHLSKKTFNKLVKQLPKEEQEKVLLQKQKLRETKKQRRAKKKAAKSKPLPILPKRPDVLSSRNNKKFAASKRRKETLPSTQSILERKRIRETNKLNQQTKRAA